MRKKEQFNRFRRDASLQQLGGGAVPAINQDGFLSNYKSLRWLRPMDIGAGTPSSQHHNGNTGHVSQPHSV